MLIITLALFAIIALIDLKPLITKKKWNAVAAFSIIFVLALTIGVLTDLGVKVPSVAKLWGDFLKSIGLFYKE